MAVETAYRCDGCAESVPGPGALRSFVLTERTVYGRVVASAASDLCAGCEAQLKTVLAGVDLWPVEEMAKLDGIVRNN